MQPGQETTFAVTAAAAGRVAPGPARPAKPGAAGPKDGEVTVAAVRRGVSRDAGLTASEKTPAPVDFVATGLIGDIKIDQSAVCPRFDAPATTRIVSGSWRASLHRFTAHPSVEGGPACPR